MTNGRQISSFDVRAKLETLLERDLLGPWDGPDEELEAGTTPAERYLLGRLVPRDVPSAPQPPTNAQGIDDEDPNDPLQFSYEPNLAEQAGLGDVEDDDSESATMVKAGSMAASALGLSFSVPDSVDTILVRAEWGWYRRVKSETQVTEQGRPRMVWKRHPAGGEVEIPLGKEDQDDRVPDARQDGVLVRYTVRHRDRRRVVDVMLVNDQPGLQRTADEARLYQARLVVSALDGRSAIFVGHNDPELSEPPPQNEDPELLLLKQLYRSHRQYAYGRQCAVDAEVRPDEHRAFRLTTTSFPAAEVPMVVPATTSSMLGVELDMSVLGSTELARNDLIRKLRPLVAGYRAWLAEQADRLANDPELARYAPAGQNALDEAHEIANRLERAINLLRDNGIAREAFRFANQAMAMQRVRSELVRERRNRPDTSVSVLLRELEVPENRSWRPFQLAFVLLCLPGLTDPEHADAHRGVDDAQVQLLFFPTGGGKTEAYLGLTAYTFAIRRLQGVVGSGAEARDGTTGVAVLMRYTLRLLTAQQFQRAAALVCACEVLRRERIDNGDTRWGDVPFRLGLWVGSKVTPNTYEDARAVVNGSHGSDEGKIGGPLQLVACPWCGSSLSRARDMKALDLRRRILLHCSDASGDCQFTPRHSRDEGIPVVTVDEEIYRLTPALVISTVDKFAQLPWKAATATLFGLVEQRCPRHGWQNPDFDGFCRTHHPAASGLPAVRPGPAMRLRPPDLIIQDELHLISDALGSMVGLFETVIDKLATRTTDGKTIRPSLVASTATIRRARSQTEQVFARDLAVFPPQVVDAGETFFSSVVAPSTSTPGRRYRGVMAPGERLKAVEIRVGAALLEHAQYLFDRYGEAADPYMTMVDYFTSTRELAGMRRLVDDDIADRLASRQVRTRRRRPTVSELTARMPSDRIAATLADLENRFDPTFDSTAALQRFTQLDRAGREQLAERLRPLDVLLATSMLQVGVDVPRLGLMVVTGQPKNTAEYIQATSRVGRGKGRPGLVVTIYQWTRPRDLAHYETFGYDHATFGMRVEGLTTTPFSDRAIDRGLTAVIVAALRHVGMAALPNPAAHDDSSVPLAGPTAAALVEALRSRAERVTHDRDEAEAVARGTQHRLDRWQYRRRRLPTGQLGYEEGPDITGLLRRPDDGAWDLWSAPISLREVEPEVALQLDWNDRSLPEAADWTYDRGPGSSS